MSVNGVSDDVSGSEVLESSCMECSEPDNPNMVQCDECDRWAHFECVGVGPEIEDSDWCCRFCSTTLSGLSLSDASVGTVGTEDKAKTSNSSVAAVSNNVRSFVASEAKVLNVGMDARTNSNVACLMLVKEETDLPATHKKLDEKKTFEYYKEKLAKFGGTDYKETVREIGQQLISDEVLKNYSYLGRRDKFCFKDYDNLTKLVVAATIESVKLRHFEIHGKAMAQSDDEAKKLHDDVERYFTKEYIKKAGTRFNRSSK